VGQRSPYDGIKTLLMILIGLAVFAVAILAYMNYQDEQQNGNELQEQLLDRSHQELNRALER
jgi:Na+/melibiose symporter-like transporter